MQTNAINNDIDDPLNLKGKLTPLEVKKEKKLLEKKDKIDEKIEKEKENYTDKLKKEK